jgi:hypothetical protein
MKGILKRLVSRVVQNDRLWTLLDKTILRASRYAEGERRKARRAQSPLNLLLSSAVQTVCPDLVVRHGVFQGMKYPCAQSAGSALFPKLLGSYERELHPVIEAICREDYSEIVDVGCAEGYYAVGLARRIPTARIYAYDTNPEACRLCGSMAELNGVSDWVTTGSFFDAQALKAIPFTRKGLILSDCEGFEKQLFRKETVGLLAGCDLLVEVHDFIDITISSYIRQLFEPTHEIEVIQSLDDIKKAQTYSFEELAPYDLATRKALLAEGRPAIMEWFWMRARRSGSEPHEVGDGDEHNADGDKDKGVGNKVRKDHESEAAQKRHEGGLLLAVDEETDADRAEDHSPEQRPGIHDLKAAPDRRRSSL